MPSNNQQLHNQYLGLRKLVSALIQSLPDFVNVAIFLVYILVLFAILGVHLYNGVFYNRCRITPEPLEDGSWPINENINRLCTKSGGGIFSCPDNNFCGNPDDFGMSPKDDDIINSAISFYGIHNFDNIGQSLLVVFQIVTAENWSTYMYTLMDVDYSFLGALYTITLVMFGSYFLMNLILAVIIQAFINITKKELDEEVIKLTNENNKAQPKNLQEIVDQLRKEEVDQMSQPEQLSYIQAALKRFLIKFKHLKAVHPIQESQLPHTTQFDKNTHHERSDSVTGLVQQTFHGGKNEQRSLFDKLSNKIGEKHHQNRQIARKIDSKEKSQLQQIDQKLAKTTDDYVSPQQTRDMNDKLNQDDLSQIKNELNFLKRMAIQKSIINYWSTKQYSQSQKDYNSSPLGPSPASKIVISVLEQKNSATKNHEHDKTFGEEIQLLQVKNQLTFRHSKTLHTISNKVAHDLNTKFDADEIMNVGEGIADPYLMRKVSNFLDQKIKKEVAHQKDDVFMLMQEERKKMKEAQEDAKYQFSLRAVAALKLMIEGMKNHNIVLKYLKKIKVVKRAESNRIYHACFLIQKSVWFQLFINLAIVVNSVILALDKYPEDRNLSDTLEKVNIGFSFLFLFEVVVKLTGIGFKAFFSEGYNIYDCIVVISSLIDILVSNIYQQKSIGVITMFRAFRLMRIFKIAKHWKRLDHLISTIMQTLRDVGTFSILMFLVMICFALLGMELYANQVKLSVDDRVDLVNGDSPDSNFDTVLNAFTTVFVVMTADGWSGIYFDHYRANPNLETTVFFILLIIIGQRILLNLFLAILLQNFDEEALKEQSEILKQAEQDQDTLANQLKSKFQGLFSCLQSKNHSEISDQLDLSGKGRILKTLKNYFIQRLNDRSLGLLSINNRFRCFMKAIVDQRIFDFFIVLVIILSSIQLALDKPLLDPDSPYHEQLIKIDIFTTTIFAIEALFRIISQGFVLNGKRSYLRNPWNIMDFIVMILSIISLTPLSDTLQFVKMFRIFRILRLIGKNDNLKCAVQALILAVPNVFNITIIILLFFFIFGIFSVTFSKENSIIVIKII